MYDVTITTTDRPDIGKTTQVERQDQVRPMGDWLCVVHNDGDISYFPTHTVLACLVYAAKEEEDDTEE